MLASKVRGFDLTAMRAKLFLNFVVIAAVAAGWFFERHSAGQLRARLDRLRAEHHQLLALQTERARFRRLRSDSDRSAPPGPINAGDNVLRQVESPPATPAPPFSIGEWTPFGSWQNQGQATARAAVATAFWAAAGGDLVAFESVLELDDAVRRKATDFFFRLPPAMRGSYATPDDLIASVTMKNIPLTEAQISWFHQSDPEHATVGVLLRSPDATPTPAVVDSPGGVGESPPELQDRPGNKMAFLTLHRSSAGWRLVVPPSAIDRIAREIALAKN